MHATATSLPAVAGDVPVPVSEFAIELVLSMEACWRVCWRRMRRSYSLPRRRRNSRDMTRRMTPMQQPANMPLDVTCHDLAMKPRIVGSVSYSKIHWGGKGLNGREGMYMNRRCSSSTTSVREGVSLIIRGKFVGVIQRSCSRLCPYPYPWRRLCSRTQRRWLQLFPYPSPCWLWSQPCS